MDLPTVVDRFAEDFDSLAVAFPGRADYRVLVLTGIDIEVVWPQDEGFD
ncbi:MAG: hypothetical protein GY745_21195 [Actinomycetia bacterium]|nr:hypothetical protein [Actinomycetes bacterium]